MTLAMKWLGATAVLSGLAALSMGCALEGADDENVGDEDVGEAQAAQLDPGMKDWVVYQIQDPFGALMGKVLVTATSGGGFTANREYWYMSTNPSGSSSLTFVGGTPQYWSTPPSGLGTLSFTTLRGPTWTSGTPSGTMLLRTNVFTGERVGLDWHMSVDSGVWSGYITWWHSTTGTIFYPGTTNALSPGTPATGTWYYDTITPL